MTYIIRGKQKYEEGAYYALCPFPYPIFKNVPGRIDRNCLRLGSRTGTDAITHVGSGTTGFSSQSTG